MATGGLPDDARAELNRLRDWRHNDAVPFLIAAKERLRMIERRLDALEPEVERMARAEDIAQALRANLWTTAQKAGAAVVAAVIAVTAVLSVVLQLTQH